MVNCHFGRIGAALIFFVIVGCADRPTTSVTNQARDVWTFANGVMIAGPLLVEIHGAPSPEVRDELDETVIVNMKEAITWSANREFTVDPEKAASQTMKVVWSFTGLDAVAPGTQQDDNADSRPREGSRIALTATLVSQGDDLSKVFGHINHADGVSDPRFAALVRQATGELFRYGEERRDGRRLGIGIGGGSAAGGAISF